MRARIWEVDSWRGVAIITMIIFHLVYDLRAYGGMPIVLHQGFWFYFQRFHSHLVHRPVRRLGRAQLQPDAGCERLS